MSCFINCWNLVSKTLSLYFNKLSYHIGYVKVPHSKQDYTYIPFPHFHVHKCHFKILSQFVGKKIQSFKIWL
jgi:hypothetical protein